MGYNTESTNNKREREQIEIYGTVSRYPGGAMARSTAAKTVEETGDNSERTEKGERGANTLVKYSTVQRTLAYTSKERQPSEEQP
ncbi:hypothetical protein Tco_1112511 [Tanacetum coccineum]|uniref:Uncharacterized protein n=1 Tax=Tanacetum coccineum TaxID=301880 RepID=A0ABQ5ISA8_9ASTR